MIVLMTDFGSSGPYLGQVHAEILLRAPDVPVINLFADLPAFRPRSAAYLLPAFVPRFPAGSVFLVVVDPGVGTDRAAMVLAADGKWFVGPDNGLFDVVLSRAGGRPRVWDLEIPGDREISSSFHGRDVFAPEAARLATDGAPTGPERRVDRSFLDSIASDLPEIVYIDHYGNAMTGLRADRVEEGRVFLVQGHELAYHRTFGQAVPGEAFWYRNSVGLVGFALREDSVARALALRVGTGFTVQDG